MIILNIMHEFFIWPNYQVYKNENYAYVKETEAVFLNQIFEICPNGLIMSIGSAIYEQYLNFPIDRNKVILLSMYKEKSIAGKLRAYVRAMFSLYRLTDHNSKFYLFIPNTQLYIFLPILLIKNFDYYLYIRGSLPIGLRGILYSFLIKKSLGGFVTGPHILRKAKLLNSNFRLVSPMIKFGINDIKNKLLRNQSKEYSLRLLYFSSVSKSKGILDLLDAFNILYGKGYNIYLTVCGTIIDNNRKMFEDKLSSINARRNVKYIESVYVNSAIIELFNNHDIFVFTSYSEGFPRVLYEAMILGIPIITSDLPTIMSVMDNKCLSYKAGDVRDLSVKMELMINSTNLRMELSRKGQSYMNRFLIDFKDVTHAEQIRDLICM